VELLIKIKADLRVSLDANGAQHSRGREIVKDVLRKYPVCSIIVYEM
jgi:hypothetical protein